jgi:hypothetical protein
MTRSALLGLLIVAMLSAGCGGGSLDSRNKDLDRPMPASESKQEKSSKDK